MELIILGSSAAIPVKERNLSSIALKYKDQIIIFDCGEDLQRQFIAANLKFNKELRILISHFHGDHIIGLPGLLFRFGLSDRTAPIIIFGPQNLFLYLYVHHKILGLKAEYPITIIEIDHLNQKLIQYNGLNSDTPIKETPIKNNVIFDSKYYVLKYTPVEHSIPSFGFAFIEKPRDGKFNPERAVKLGIPESRIWKKLQHGDIIEYSGRKIDPIKEAIVGPKREGRKITYSGDTIPCEALVELGMDSDILVHEATFSKELEENAVEKKHSTSIDAANVAKRMNAKKLILTHISSRYQEDAVKLLQEAKNIFPNTILAEDLLRIQIN